ncbi:MAG: TetR/AcrR family transcriptional regulator [Roseiarcus sp.]
MIEPGRGRGRPRDLDKRRAILDAAGALFHERGIAATTMEGVAERAGVSKMTVYAHFPDKPALLSAVFERNIAAMRLADLAEQPDLASSLEELSAFGERLVAYLTRPDIARTGGLLRVGAGEHPHLAAAFYAAGPQAMVAKVAAFLKSLAARGFLVLDDPALAAEILTTAWLGLSQLRQNLGVAGPPDAEEISRRVRLATGALLRAWAATGA